jgi:hypothetical protein
MSKRGRYHLCAISRHPGDFGHPAPVPVGEAHCTMREAEAVASVWRNQPWLSGVAILPSRRAAHEYTRNILDAARSEAGQ